MKKIILASTSPRRQELLKLLNHPFEICVENVEEFIDKSISPEENVQNLAKLKAGAVAKKYRSQWVIGADTMVCLDDHILGKPQDKVQAKEMLQLLSGKKHRVITGVALVKGSEVINFYETTYVKMKVLSDVEIAEYIATKEPMDKAGSRGCNSQKEKVNCKYEWQDKAGAYGIQGKGAVFIEGIEGDYYNVVGLPIHQIYKRLFSN